MVSIVSIIFYWTVRLDYKNMCFKLLASSSYTVNIWSHSLQILVITWLHYNNVRQIENEILEEKNNLYTVLIGQNSKFTRLQSAVRSLLSFRFLIALKWVKIFKTNYNTTTNEVLKISLCYMKKNSIEWILFTAQKLECIRMFYFELCSKTH